MERWHAIKRLLAMGVSNLHIDLADSRRARGVPIVYYPRISEAARRREGFRPDHPLPSSDIVIAENACRPDQGGGRAFRVRTCVDGWVCIVCAHYEVCLHGGVYPVGPDGEIVDAATGRTYLEDALVPGVELLRCVIYQMARVDDFAFAVQAEYEARAGSGGDTDGAQPNEQQRALLREVYAALRAPLDERLRMLHPWLERKADNDESAAFGARGRWERKVSAIPQ
jgi:hypothetical protein